MTHFDRHYTNVAMPGLFADALAQGAWGCAGGDEVLLHAGSNHPMPIHTPANC